jgi:acetoacetate decarboxylase
MTADEFDPEAYTGMPSGERIPAPQLVKNVRMLIVGFEADADVLAEVLPPGLEPHPNNLIQMNMYQVPTSEQSSHLDPYSLTYLTVEVADHDSRAISEAGGEMPIPGRYWVGYWNDSAEMQAFARELGGIPSQAGTCTWEESDGELTSTLSVDGRAVIEATAEVGDEQIDTLTGHLHYYANRQIPNPAGNEAEINELVEFPIPFVSELYEAAVTDVEFNFPEGSRYQQFAPTAPLSTPSVLHGTVTFTYPQGRTVRDYLTEESAPTQD